MKSRKAQANPQQYIALLIMVIGVAMILYIMMLPPGDRADLLEQNRTTAAGEKNQVTVIMTKEPGTLTNIAQDEIVSDLPSFNLYSKTDATVLSEFGSIYIKKSLFDEQDRNISFNLDDLTNTNNIILSYNVPRHSGILTILLNGKILTSQEVSTASPAPIKLPRDWLQSANTLVFKVSGPGIEFWRSNEYLIEGMKITADVTDNSNQENRQTVLVTDEEMANIESFQLSFIVDCKVSDVSPIEIYLNKRLIYTSVPDCGMKIKVPAVDGSRLRQGENDLLFKIEKGNYLLYSLETTLKLKKPLYPTYYFYLNSDTFNKIKNGNADINVTLLFTNSVDDKQGVVFVNDFFVDLNTQESGFTRIVNSFVREGNNAVEIRPKSDKLDILELRILLAE